MPDQSNSSLSDGDEWKIGVKLNGQHYTQWRYALTQQLAGAQAEAAFEPRPYEQVIVSIGKTGRKRVNGFVVAGDRLK